MINNFTQAKVFDYTGGDETGDSFYNLYTVPSGFMFDGSIIINAFITTSALRVWLFPSGSTPANASKGLIERHAIIQGTVYRIDGIHLNAGDMIYVLCDDANSGTSSTSVVMTGMLTANP